MRDRRNPWLVTALVATAVALRVACVVSFARDPLMQTPIHDAAYYLDLGRSVAARGDWPQEPAFLTWLYPWVLSWLFRLAPSTVVSVHIFQAALTLFALPFLFRATARDFGRPAAWWAVSLAALYGPLLALEGWCLADHLLFVLTIAALYLWPRPGSGIRAAFAFGIVGGALAIGRGVFLALPGLAIVSDASAWRNAHARGRWLAIVGGVALALAPLAIHQTRTTGRLCLLSLNGGMNLYLGSSPSVLTEKPPAEMTFNNGDATGSESAWKATGRALSPVQVDSFWTARALALVRSRPIATLRLWAMKSALYFSPHEIRQTESFEALASEHPVLRLSFVRFWIVLPLAVLGATLLLLERRRNLLPWLALVGLGLIQTVLFLVTARYRLTFLAGFFGLAGFGAAGLVARFKDRRGRAWAFLPPAVLALQLLIPTARWWDVRAMNAAERMVLYAGAGRDSEARAAYAQALTFGADDPDLLRDLGMAALALDRPSAALQACSRAVALAPRDAKTRASLGFALVGVGLEDSAAATFQRADRIGKIDPASRDMFAALLWTRGKRDEACEQWSRALAADSTYTRASRALKLAAQGADPIEEDAPASSTRGSTN